LQISTQREGAALGLGLVTMAHSGLAVHPLGTSDGHRVVPLHCGEQNSPSTIAVLGQGRR
jgi:hypothetical protein